jgi:hypothetical protein
VRVSIRIGDWILVQGWPTDVWRRIDDIVHPAPFVALFGIEGKYVGLERVLEHCPFGDVV